MFKYATLIATVAAGAETTVKTDATKAASTVKTDAKKADSDAHKAAAHVKSTAKNAVLSSSADSSADITSLTDSSWTQADITTANKVAYGVDVVDACGHCLFAGGDWSAAVEKVDKVTAVTGVKAEPKTAKKAAVVEVKAVTGVAAVAAKDGDCVFGGKGFAATSAKDTDHATRWADLTNKAMFDGLNTCSDHKSIGDMVSTYDAATMMDKAATFDKKTHLGASWDNTWGSDAVTAGDFAYLRTVMPHSFDGGLKMSVNASADDSTHYTIRVTGATDRYFDKDTMIAAGLGNTGVVQLLFADTIELVATSSAASDADKNTFKVNFQRISKEGIALETLKHGGVIVWVVIGCVLLCLIIVGVIFWKKCSKKEEFYNADDLYARV